MENAGRSVAEAAMRLNGGAIGNTFTVVCGKGNNGGDGCVAARHLYAAGARVGVVLLAGRPELGRETLRQLSILEKIAAGEGSGGRMSIVMNPGTRRPTRLRRPSAIIDAVLGTGFRGTLRGAARGWVEWINRSGSAVISVDIPSGLNSDDGTVGGACVRADITVTMGALKSGLLIGEGPDMCGRVEIADLGIGQEIGRSEEDQTFLIRRSDIPECLPNRPRNSHKHSVGKILILAGSVGLTGAAALAASAAIRGGAGAVVLGIPGSLYPVLGKKLTEVMVKPLPESKAGTLSSASLDHVRRELEWADVILAGPGLGMDPAVHDFLENLLKSKNKRFLLDADALNHLALDGALMGRLRKNTCILTPHSGEFSRLSGRPVSDIERERLIFPPRYTRKHGIHLILKGAPTVCVTPKGTLFVNSTGNPGMASAGMGDVLAGLISAIWAGSGDPVRSAYGGVFLHGLAGDRTAKKFGARSMAAGDVLNELPQVIAESEII